LATLDGGIKNLDHGLAGGTTFCGSPRRDNVLLLTPLDQHRAGSRCFVEHFRKSLASP
jgi:hypothetical protein